MVHLGTLATKIESILYNEKIKSILLQETMDKMRKTLFFMSDSISELNRFYTGVNKEQKYNRAIEVHSIAEMLSAKCAYIGASIEMDLDEDIEAFGYKNAFANVVLIIVDNSLDIFKERSVRGGVVNITLAKTKEGISVEIKDNRGGIDIDPPELIFELLTSKKRDGSGMGFAMAKVLVEERLGGKISVQNKGGGAWFVLKLMDCGL